MFHTPIRYRPEFLRKNEAGIILIQPFPFAIVILRQNKREITPILGYILPCFPVCSSVKQLKIKDLQQNSASKTGRPQGSPLPRND
jgi:hypothetical protein